MVYINIKGKEYALRFDLNALEKIQELYGSITDFGKAIEKISEAKKVATILINEGISYHNYQHGTNDKLFAENEIGMLLDAKYCGTLSEKIMESFLESIGETEETEKKT